MKSHTNAQQQRNRAQKYFNQKQPKPETTQISMTNMNRRRTKPNQQKFINE
jgi:hypothetical protein